VSALAFERQAELEGLGRKIGASLLISNRWIIRSVESVRMVDGGTLRRRFSRHFILPPQGVRAPLDGGVLIPIMLVNKHVFVRCNVYDASRRLRSPLTASGGRWLTFSAVSWAAAEILQGRMEVPPWFLNRVWELVGPTHINRPALFAPLGPGFLQEEEEAVQVLGASPDFVQLANAVADGYLLFAVVDPADERQVLTVEYEVPMPDPKDVNPKGFRGLRIALGQRIGWTPLPFKLEIGSDYATASTHVDIAALQGLSFGRRELDPGHHPGGPRHRIFHRGTTFGGARFRFTQQPGKRGAYVAFQVHPGDTAMLRGWMAGVAILSILAALAVAEWLGAHLGGSAPPLLLLGPAAIPLLVAGQGEHPYVTKVVRGVRYAVIFLTLWAIAGATAIAILTTGSGLADNEASATQLSRPASQGQPQPQPHNGGTDARVLPGQGDRMEASSAGADGGQGVDSIALAVTLSALCLGASVNTGVLYVTYRRSRPKVAGHEYVDLELNRIA
jgi:hypothetical protein